MRSAPAAASGSSRTRLRAGMTTAWGAKWRFWWCRDATGTRGTVPTVIQQVPVPDHDAQADAAAIDRVLQGETDQFAILVRRYQSALYRHAVAMVWDHDAAADMVQDAFIRA